MSLYPHLLALDPLPSPATHPLLNNHHVLQRTRCFQGRSRSGQELVEGTFGHTLVTSLAPLCSLLTSTHRILGSTGSSAPTPQRTSSRSVARSPLPTHPMFWQRNSGHSSQTTSPRANHRTPTARQYTFLSSNATFAHRLVFSLDPVQVTQMAKYLETVYVSGWQSSSTAPSTNEPGPDLAGMLL